MILKKSSLFYNSVYSSHIFHLIAVVVGFVDTLVEVNETDGNATLNVSITMPGPEVAAIEIMFSLRVDSSDGSAGSYRDGIHQCHDFS